MESCKKYIKEKANYCLSCVIKPCQVGCPLNNDTTDFIKYVKEEDYESAYNKLIETTVLGGICGRICPHEKQCQGSCIRRVMAKPVCIGDLEAFVFDKAIENNYKISKISNIIENRKIAVVGSGPAGLTCAAFLARNGAKVTIYEKYNKLGGILRHGIPEFRLDRDILDKNINKILELGIEVKYNVELGKNYSIDKLENEYDAIFLGFGANISTRMNIEGEELNGVYGGNELLESGKHPNYDGKMVAVIGGGNVAMDTARTIKRLGAKNVYVIYRRSEKQMPAEIKEVKEAKEEGIEFLFQNNITKILGDDKVEKIECIKTELIKKEGQGRAVPVNVEGSNYIMDMDYVVMAIGSKVEDSIVNNMGVECTKYGYIQVDEEYRTSKEKVFAGGDIAGTKSTVAWASRAGREAAKSIINYLMRSI